MISTDFLVIGSGIAGLSYALKISEKRPDLNISIITKSEGNESNTRYAQGGIATVINHSEDSFEHHIHGPPHL